MTADNRSVLLTFIIDDYSIQISSKHYSTTIKTIHGSCMKKLHTRGALSVRNTKDFVNLKESPVSNSTSYIPNIKQEHNKLSGIHHTFQHVKLYVNRFLFLSPPSLRSINRLPPPAPCVPLNNFLPTVLSPEISETAKTVSTGIYFFFLFFSVRRERSFVRKKTNSLHLQYRICNFSYTGDDAILRYSVWRVWEGRKKGWWEHKSENPVYPLLNRSMATWPR